MQNELDPALGIQLIGVNAADSLSGVDSVTLNRDIPFLQDTVKADAHGEWAANQRDIFILDKNGVLVDSWSLDPAGAGGHDLSVSANYEMLKSLLEAEAAK